MDVEDQPAGGETRPAPIESAASAELIQREIPRLAALIVFAVAAFLLTRAVATSNRDMNRRDAAVWYERGRQEIRAGNVERAIEAFRRATIRDRNNVVYVPALGRALATAGRNDEARRTLLALRETQPDNADVNLQLARLAAGRDDVVEAQRYYHYALYSPGVSDNAPARRSVRRELAEFLVTQHLGNRAIAELLVLAADAPPTAAFHLDLAALFVRAGDRRHALVQYEEALKLEPDSADAIVGAGESAFELGDYVLARRLLQQVPRPDDRIRELRTVADLVVSSDPLAVRISARERRRRVLAATQYAEQRLHACSDVSDPARPGADTALLKQWDALRPEIRSPLARDSDTVDAVFELVERTERAVTARCPPATPMDRALLAIAERHRRAEEP